MRSPRTIDQARLLANVEERAKTLEADGYAIEPFHCSIDFWTVYQTFTPYHAYIVNLPVKTCSCPFFKNSEAGTCKHLRAVQIKIAAIDSMQAEAGARYLMEIANAEHPRHGCDADCGLPV